MKTHILRLFALLGALLLAHSASAINITAQSQEIRDDDLVAPILIPNVNFTEMEPNDTRATAQVIMLTAPGDTITGNSQGATGTNLDYYQIHTPVQALAIYMNRLTLNQANTGSIRGLGQTATGPNGVGPGMPNPAATDNAAQTSSVATGMMNQWYSFGRAGTIDYRVTGSASTTANYIATFTQVVITPTNLGSFAAGSITFTNTGLNSTQDTEVFVYDVNLMPIPGYTNDDFLDGTPVPPGGSTLNSLLTRDFAPGVYYLAISNFNTADNQLSPADEGSATGTFLPYDGAMTNSSTGTLASIPFQIRDSDGNVLTFNASKPGPFDIYWATFVVIPEPSTVSLAILGVGALGLAAWRRRRTA